MDADAIEQLLCGLEHTTVRERTRAQLELTKLRPAAIAPNATTIAAAIAKRLEHELRSVRVAALQLMHSKLRSDTLATHAGAIARQLNDTDAYVQRLVLQTLRKVDASALAPHSEAMMERLVEIGGDDWSMRMSALKAMLRLAPDAIVPHAPTIAEWLGTDVDVYVQCLAMRVLGMLDPDERAPYDDAISSRLEAADNNLLRSAAAEALGVKPTLIIDGLDAGDDDEAAQA